MLGFSTTDGFISVKEGVDEMIKYVANEPSVGLYFVQQHGQSSMPYLLGVRDKVVEKVHEVALHTEDIEDSIYAIRSMTECGLPIADEMITDIRKSLNIMSASRPKRGLITPMPFHYSPVGSLREGGSSRGYLSSVLNSAKQKAAGLRWSKAEPSMPFTSPLPVAAANDDIHTPTSDETDELPVSSSLVVEDKDQAITVDDNTETKDVSVLLESYDKFRIDRAAKLEEWLSE